MALHVTLQKRTAIGLGDTSTHPHPYEDDHITVEVTSYEETDVNDALGVLFYCRKCSVTKLNR